MREGGISLLVNKFWPRPFLLGLLIIFMLVTANVFAAGPTWSQVTDEIAVTLDKALDK